MATIVDLAAVSARASLVLQPAVGDALTILDPATDTGYALMALDPGNVAWENAYSGPRGTQGARLASATPQNRPLVMGVRAYGANKDALAAKFSAVSKAVRALHRFGGQIKWRSSNQTHTQYFEVMAGSHSLAEWTNRVESNNIGQFTIEAICAPYVKGDPLAAMTFSSQTLPAVLSLGTPIPGDAPALADVSITTSGGVAAPIWAMIAWAERPTTPLTGSVSPFGLIEAENPSDDAAWATTADADYRGGSGLQTTAGGAGVASAMWAIDPSSLIRDDYTQGDIAIEVWARVELASTLVSPKLILSARPAAGVNYGPERYSSEWGSAGKLITKPSSGTVFRFVKLGTLSLNADLSRPVKWKVRVDASWAAGSSGTFGLDYLALVIARKRAVSPSHLPNDASYPKFIRSINGTTKTIRSDGSGLSATSGGVAHDDHGLGQVIEFPPGNVDVLAKLSSLVPDDPTSDPTSEQLSHTGVNVSFTVTPRWAVLRAA